MSRPENVFSAADTRQPKASRRTFIGSLGAAVALPLVTAAGAPSLLAEAGAKRESAQGATGAASSNLTYSNPLKIDIGDPNVLRAPDGNYYIYGTGGGGMGGPPPATTGPTVAPGQTPVAGFTPPPGRTPRKDDGTAFPTFVSPNLVDWQPLGNTHHRDNIDTAWCIGAFWAPAVYYHQEKYYMFYSAQWRDNPTNEKENFRIGVAVSDSPAGPFKDIRNAPIFDPGYPAIDADVLFDTDGRIYLYFSRCCYKHPVESELADWAKKEGWFTEIEESWIYAVELKPDFSAAIGDPVLICRPPVSLSDYHAAWENIAVLSKAVNRRWTEGPCSFKHGDKYYIIYSANSVAGPDYALGYATSDHPLGPFTKALNNPVATKNTDRGGNVTTTAHNCVAWSPDGAEMYCLYGAKLVGSKSRGRTLFLCKMEVRPDGLLFVSPPDTDLVHPYPSGSKST